MYAGDAYISRTTIATDVFAVPRLAKFVFFLGEPHCLDNGEDMDLSKMPHERKLYLCKWYFYAGFALLPFLWAVNAIWFAKQAFIVPHFEEQKQIRKYVIFSGIGAVISLTAYVSWIIVFQTYRASWGEFADSISYIFPAGIP